MQRRSGALSVTFRGVQLNGPLGWVVFTGTLSIPTRRQIDEAATGAHSHKSWTLGARVLEEAFPSPDEKLHRPNMPSLYFF